MIDLTGYHLTFDEEFNNLSVSATGTGSVWADTRPGSILSPGVDIGYGQSAFVDPSTGIQPFSLTDGALRIRAAPAPESASALIGQANWTSGLVHSKNSFAQTYGYFEMRALLPAEAGTWPAFWLLSADGQWPPEIDVVESFGADPTALSSSLHSGTTEQPTLQQVWSSQPTLTSGYHTFGALWTVESITFYYDGEAVGRLATPGDMHKAMYPLVSLAISQGDGIAETPKTMLVDYVRVYSADPSMPSVDLDTISSPDEADTSSLYGASTASSGPVVNPPGATPDVLTIHISGDSWSGPPQFIVTVDGKRVGDIFEVTALHGEDQWQDVIVRGNFGIGPHHVEITYINDANANPYYDAGANTFVNDRNLFVSQIALNGTTHGTNAVVSNTAAMGFGWLDPDAAVMAGNGKVLFETGVAPTQPTPTPPAAPGQDVLVLHISGDSWSGPPKFDLMVDGRRIGGPYEVTALHGEGQSQDITIRGNFGAGAHEIAITYLNDGNAGAYYDAAQGGFVNDRNIFVSGLGLNGAEYGIDAVVSNTAAIGFGWLDPQAAVMAGNGTVVLRTAATKPPASPPSDPPPDEVTDDVLILRISGDSWSGAPEFSLNVGGRDLGTFEVTALHGQEQWQDIMISGNFSDTDGRVLVTYLNDGNKSPYYDSTQGGFVNDRNLFISQLTLNGVAHGLESVLYNTAAVGYDWLDPQAVVMAANGAVLFDL